MSTTLLQVFLHFLASSLSFSSLSLQSYANNDIQHAYPSVMKAGAAVAAAAHPHHHGVPQLLLGWGLMCSKERNEYRDGHKQTWELQCESL